MNPNRSLHKLLRIIFSEVLMEYFDISGWHDDSSKIEVWLDEKNYMEHSDYKKMRAERYASFDQGDGRKFEEGKLLLEDLRTIALASGEPKQISGKQELYEMIINQYI